MYVSNRDIPLITQQVSDVPMLTAENYPKWYDLYLLLPDGTVETVSWDNETLCDGWRDHCIIPEYFVKLAEELGARYDEKTFEAVKEHYQWCIG